MTLCDDSAELLSSSWKGTRRESSAATGATCTKSSSAAGLIRTCSSSTPSLASSRPACRATCPLSPIVLSMMPIIRSSPSVRCAPHFGPCSEMSTVTDCAVNGADNQIVSLISVRAPCSSLLPPGGITDCAVNYANSDRLPHPSKHHTQARRHLNCLASQLFDNTFRYETSVIHLEAVAPCCCREV